MYSKYGVSLAAALVLAGCSGSDESAAREKGPAQVARDTVPPAAAGHDMHAMQDSTGAAPKTAQATSGMDHAAHSAAAAAETGGAGDQMNHSAHGAAGGASAQPGMDHSRMNMVGGATTSRRGSGSMAGMDHGAQNHGTAPAPARRGTAAGAPMDHAAMGHGSTSRTAGAHHGAPSAAAGATAHGSHAASPGGQAHGGMQHGQPGGAAPVAPDRATDKLLTLVGALVRDPAVQEEIRQDPALREAWSDPGVRRVITNRP